MLIVDVVLSPPIDWAAYEQRALAACYTVGLRVTLKGTLAQYPACVHWHLKRGAEKGVLEMTLWPAGRRLWFKVGDHRRGDWMTTTIAQLKQVLENDVVKG